MFIIIFTFECARDFETKIYGDVYFTEHFYIATLVGIVFWYYIYAIFETVVLKNIQKLFKSGIKKVWEFIKSKEHNFIEKIMKCLKVVMVSIYLFFKKDFWKIKVNILELFVFILIAVALMVAGEFYKYYVPKMEDVEYSTIGFTVRSMPECEANYMNEEDYTGNFPIEHKNKKIIDKIIAINKAMSSEKRYQRERLGNFVKIGYKLKNGIVINRKYHIDIIKHTKVLSDLHDLEDYRKMAYKVYTYKENDNMRGLLISYYNDKEIKLEGLDFKGLLDAAKKDNMERSYIDLVVEAKRRGRFWVFVGKKIVSIDIFDEDNNVNKWLKDNKLYSYYELDKNKIDNLILYDSIKKERIRIYNKDDMNYILDNMVIPNSYIYSNAEKIHKNYYANYYIRITYQYKSGAGAHNYWYIDRYKVRGIKDSSDEE
jgi:hypothetical protein